MKRYLCVMTIVGSTLICGIGVTGVCAAEVSDGGWLCDRIMVEQQSGTKSDFFKKAFSKAKKVYEDTKQKKESDSRRVSSSSRTSEPAGLSGYWRIFITNIRVKKRWSRSERLDLYFTIEKNGKTIYKSYLYENTQNVNPDEYIVVNYRAGDTVGITIYDKDLVKHDKLDTFSIPSGDFKMGVRPTYEGKNTILTVGLVPESIRNYTLVTNVRTYYGGYFLLNNNAIILADSVNERAVTRKARVVGRSNLKEVSALEYGELRLHLSRRYKENEAGIRSAIKNLDGLGMLFGKWMAARGLDIDLYTRKGLEQCLKFYCNWYNECVTKDMDMLFYLLPPSPAGSDIERIVDKSPASLMVPSQRIERYVYTGRDPYWKGVDFTRDSSEHPGAVLEMRSKPVRVSYLSTDYRISQQATYFMRGATLILSTKDNPGPDPFTPGTPDFQYFGGKARDFGLASRGEKSHMVWDLFPWAVARVLDAAFGVIEENGRYDKFRKMYCQIAVPNRSKNDLKSDP